MDTRQALLGGVATIALGAGLLMSANEAKAQSTQGIVTTQSTYRADAAQFFVSATSTTCTSTQASVANLTLTITPPAGQYVYLTGFDVQVAPNATGAASATGWSSTNLTGAPAWVTNVNASATGSQTFEYVLSESYPTGLKSTVPGTAVTIVPTATTASAYACPHAWGYYSPQ